MNFKEDFTISEVNKLNPNQNLILNKKPRKNLFIYILILFLIIIIVFLLLSLKKKINHINKFKYNEKNIYYEIIKKLNFIENKLKNIEQDILSNKEIVSYNNNSIYNLLSIKKVLDYQKIRIGNNKDGGYILLNDLKNIKIGYSFGISREISFDKGLADNNIDVFMYDHTINKLPFENPKFHWKKIGLTGRRIKNHNMKTLRELKI